MAGSNTPGEPRERHEHSVARDAHDALPFHRPGHSGPMGTATPEGQSVQAVMAHHDTDGHDHPGEMVYVKVAAILAAVTAIEVVIYYIEAIESVLVPALLLLSAGKFIAVVGYFMHLKFDDKRFTWIFVAGLVLSISVFLGFAAMFLYHNFDVIDLQLKDQSI